MYINTWTEYEVKLYLYWWLYLSRSCSQRDRQGPFNTCDASWLTSFPLNPLALGQYVNNQSRGKHQQTPDSYCNTGRKCKRVTGTCLMHRPSHGHLLLRCMYYGSSSLRGIFFPLMTNSLQLTLGFIFIKSIIAISHS